MFGVCGEVPRVQGAGEGWQTLREDLPLGRGRDRSQGGAAWQAVDKALLAAVEKQRQHQMEECFAHASWQACMEDLIGVACF